MDKENKFDSGNKRIRDRLAENLLSLWPRTHDQKHNSARKITIQRAVEELAGNDVDRYNRIVDAINEDDYTAFCTAVLEQ